MGGIARAASARFERARTSMNGRARLRLLAIIPPMTLFAACSDASDRPGEAPRPASDAGTDGGSHHAADAAADTNAPDTADTAPPEPQFDATALTVTNKELCTLSDDARYVVLSLEN